MENIVALKPKRDDQSQRSASCCHGGGGYVAGPSEGLVRDTCVAGVDNGRGDGSLFVRAWIVLTNEGGKQGKDIVVKKLHQWVEGRLSRHKWLTGGVEVVDSVSA